MKNIFIIIAVLLVLVGMVALSQVAMAEEPVYFADAHLKAVVENSLGISDPTPTDMLFLTDLFGANYTSIVNLTGIEYATNLTGLVMHHNQISDISALSGLTNLTILNLDFNQIRDISALSGLTNLTMLALGTNQISDISALSGLTNLTWLFLGTNQISDISALSGLTNLTWLVLTNNQISDISALSGLTNLTNLSLSYNPLNIEAYCDIPHIITNNPYISIYYDPCPYPDFDKDRVPDTCDNCPSTPNGPIKGTCIIGNNTLCYSHEDCGSSGYCSQLQEDSYPPSENGIGDACDCEGNFDCDIDCDGTDAATFKVDFGRSSFNNPCNGTAQCNGDFECDGDVDGTDAAKFKADFGRSPFLNPCPSCPADPWCIYP